jgi:hypothetical protein
MPRFRQRLPKSVYTSEVPTSQLASSWELVLGQDLLAATDVGRDIVALHAQQPRVFGERNEALVPVGKHDDQGTGLLHELTPPALPADGLTPSGLVLTRQSIGGGQGQHEARHQDRHSHAPRGFLRRMPQHPRLLRVLDAAMLEQTAVVSIIQGRQGLSYRSGGQEHRVAPWPIVTPLPLAHDHGMDRVGLNVAPVVLAPVLRRAIRVLVHFHETYCVMGSSDSQS